MSVPDNGDLVPSLLGASGILLDGRVVRNRGVGVVIERGRITGLTGIADSSGAEPPVGWVHEYAGATLLPGLIDAHTHICLAHGEDLTRVLDEELLEASTEIGRTAAAAILAAGVTTARDLGCRGQSAQRVREDVGDATGPALVVSGRPVTASGGHFAAFGLTVKGAAEARRAVDQLVAEGSDLVKVILTGGTLTPGSAIGIPQFDLEEVRALTDRAHHHGLRVAAHAHGTAGIELAIAARVDTIEHCSWLDRVGNPGPVPGPLVEAIAAQDQVVVIAGPIPSGLVDTEADLGRSTDAPDPGRVASVLRAWRNGAQLRRMGVRIALGSDSLFGQFSDSRDLIYRAEAMVATGAWDASEVLQLVTEGGAAALGKTGEVGCLGVGATADLLVVEGDPSVDTTALRRVLAVYRAGRLVSGSPGTTRRIEGLS